MEMFRNFRLARGKSFLRKRLAKLKRVRFTNNISQAKTMGLVWDASKPDEFQALSQFHQKMADRNIDLKIIGYFPGKELPARLTAIRYLTCLKKDDINFAYRPVAPESNKFIDTRFDILIDLNFNNVFPLSYITSLSQAGFKVGVFDDNYPESPFDLMMEFKGKAEIISYLTEVINYLELINKNTN
jgi:hypothetical protein